MVKFLLIRHGKTLSNLERRYIGDPDEPLCNEGLEGVRVLRESGDLPPVTVLMSGPALRCRQTAKLLFPGMDIGSCPLNEIDFGVFKGKSADDLLHDKDYKVWVETGCISDIPGGDSVTSFKDLCCDIFQHIAEISVPGTTALVIHGGNIMAILERFARPSKDFYDYYVPNCGFYLCRYENGVLTVDRKNP